MGQLLRWHAHHSDHRAHGRSRELCGWKQTTGTVCRVTLATAESVCSSCRPLQAGSPAMRKDGINLPEYLEYSLPTNLKVAPATCTASPTAP